MLIAGCFALSTAAHAQSGEEVAKSRCFACHAIDQKKVGPSFKEVAAKYKGTKGAEARLVGVLKDGKGHPKIDAPDAQLKAAVQYVLKQ
jgi:cytochrome c